jgi:hypothetical protein
VEPGSAYIGSSRWYPSASCARLRRIRDRSTTRRHLQGRTEKKAEIWVEMKRATMECSNAGNSSHIGTAGSDLTQK